MNIVVLVPRRADNGRRDRIWRWVRSRWQTEHPDWPVVEGYHDDGPFNRSAAINRAAREAGCWDVAVIGDADSFAHHSQLDAAVATAAETGQITFAFNVWRALGEAMSDRIMDGYLGNWGEGVFATLWDSCSSMLAVRRDLWDACQGFDEGFESWGCEDIGFAHAARTFGGGERRIAGDLWHLYHDPQPRDNVHNNVARADRYHAALGKPDEMRALMAEIRN